MSETKKTIPLEKLKELTGILGDMNASLEKAIADYESAGITYAQVKNWTTLQRGLVYVARTAKQICGPASKIQTIDLNRLSIDDDSKKSKRKAQDQEDDQKLNAAAAKVREMRKRKPKSP
jgi:hypothetical protein